MHLLRLNDMLPICKNITLSFSPLFICWICCTKSRSAISSIWRASDLKSRVCWFHPRAKWNVSLTIEDNGHFSLIMCESQLGIRWTYSLDTMTKSAPNHRQTDRRAERRTKTQFANGDFWATITNLFNYCYK